MPTTTSREPEWRQYLAAFLASLVSLSTGVVAGWSATALPLLVSGQGYSMGGIRKITLEEGAWITSIINLGSLFGSIPAGYLSYSLGRKNYLLSLAGPLIVGWFCILFNGNSVLLIYIGRTLCGWSYGSLNVALPIYNNEICNERIRGRIGTFYDLMQCFGIIYIYILGAVLPLFWSTLACLVIPVIFFCTFIWMPESPLYLWKCGHKDEAIRNIKWLRGPYCDIDLEISKIKKALMEGKEEKNGSEDYNDRREINCCCLFAYCQRIKHFLSQQSTVTLRTVILVFFMFVLQRSCGAIVVIYYTVDVFATGHSSLSPNLATILTGFVQLAFGLIPTIFIDKLGRRGLLAGSFLVMAASIFVFAMYLRAIENGNAWLEDTMGWLPTICVCLFLGMFRLGVSPIPWFMAPELIPIESQNWAFSGIVCITWGVSFLWSNIYYSIVQSFGQLTVYYFFTAVSFTGFVYTLWLVPETKSKSREQIQKDLVDRFTSYEGI